MRYLTTSDADTAAFGAAMATALKAGDAVLLHGDLGAGKSVLARGVARGLGVTAAMPSPTFTLVQPHEGRIPVYHFDLYRLADADEFFAAGLDEMMDADGVCLIEWPIDELDVQSKISITIHRTADEQQRQIDVDAHGFARAMDMKPALKRWEVRA